MGAGGARVGRVPVDRWWRSVAMAVSYGTDALADLVGGAIDPYGPWRTSRFLFDAEPQEFRWVLRGGVGGGG